MSTGPFLPSLAISKASWIVPLEILNIPHHEIVLHDGLGDPTISTSWKESFPRLLTATFPVIATMGTESRYALAMPVTRLVAPGPLVARTTPVSRWPWHSGRPHGPLPVHGPINTWQDPSDAR